MSTTNHVFYNDRSPEVGISPPRCRGCSDHVWIVNRGEVQTIIKCLHVRDCNGIVRRQLSIGDRGKPKFICHGLKMIQPTLEPSVCDDFSGKFLSVRRIQAYLLSAKESIGFLSNRVISQRLSKRRKNKLAYTSFGGWYPHGPLNEEYHPHSTVMLSTV